MYNWRESPRVLCFYLEIYKPTRLFLPSRKGVYFKRNLSSFFCWLIIWFFRFIMFYVPSQLSLKEFPGNPLKKSPGTAERFLETHRGFERDFSWHHWRFPSDFSRIHKEDYSCWKRSYTMSFTIVFICASRQWDG